jgi:predicted nucleotidyltransferase
MEEIEEYCRPALLEDLKSLVRSLNQQGVEYLLIGGYALFAHGYHRATTDIDILVPATQESGEKVKAALMVLPDQAAKDLEPDWFTEGENIRIADAFLVDVMQYSVTVDLEGIPVRTVNLEGLLRTKQTMRDKDVSDRHILERAISTFKEN